MEGVQVSGAWAPSACQHCPPPPLGHVRRDVSLSGTVAPERHGVMTRAEAEQAPGAPIWEAPGTALTRGPCPVSSGHVAESLRTPVFLLTGGVFGE